jgi:hypothetical protein
LREADNLDVVSAADAVGGEGELLDVLVLVHAGSFEGGFELLELRRKNTGLEIHGCRGVLHDAVVDNDELLDVARNGGTGIGVDLRGPSGEGDGEARRCCQS